MWLGLIGLALPAASCGWAWLASLILARRSLAPHSHQILVGLTSLAPLIALALVLTFRGQIIAATTAGAGGAITYLLMAPAVIAAGPLASRAWSPWRRGVLPFCMAVAATWYLLGVTGHFTPLDGQFLITLFLLGTWLFRIECRAANGRIEQCETAEVSAGGNGNPGPDVAGNPANEPAAGEQPAGVPAANPRPARPTAVDRQPARTGAAVSQADRTDNPSRLVSALLMTIALLVSVALTVAVVLLVGDLPAEATVLVPLLAVLACAGPIGWAAVSRSEARADWLGALGYAALAAACMVPGLAGFLQIVTLHNGTWIFQPLHSAPPLYGPDGAVLALAAGLLLALGHEGLTGNRSGRQLVAGTWGLWLIWVGVSAVLN